MSTKTSKRTTVASTTKTSKTTSRSSAEPGAKESTPVPSAAMSSPVSPTRLSRLQERNELVNLNDRLANYINRVKYLEAENNELSHQIQIAEETVTRESTSIKYNYEKEMEVLRHALELANKSKAASEYDCTKLTGELNQLKQKYTKKEKDLAACEKTLINHENQIGDLKEQLNHNTTEMKRLQKELKDLRFDKDKFEEECRKLKAELDKEVLVRISLSDENQSIKDHLRFKEELFQQEIMESKTNRSIIETEVEKKLQKQHDYDMAKAINELREQFMLEVEKTKAEYEMKNKAELSNAMDRVSDYTKQSHSLHEELSNCNGRIEALLIKVTNLETENVAMNTKVKDCEEKMNIERRINARRLAEKDDDIAQLRNELERQLQEYHELMDIKLTLDFEIATYRKLLESEETRLNISSDTSKVSGSRSTPLRRTPLRGKRKRGFFSEEMSSDFSSTSSCKDDVEINEQDLEGRYVKLFNKGEKDVNIGGWQLFKKVDDKETSFKFHRSVVIKAGSYVTVWSADSGATHSPPSTIVMKGQKWFTGDKNVSILLNSEGNSVAERETSRRVISSSVIHSSGSVIGTNSEADGDQRCSIM